jgi:8-oxo-dGTP pyrophosphatase MutT (NUDIX family)
VSINLTLDSNSVCCLQRPDRLWPTHPPIQWVLPGGGGGGGGVFSGGKAAEAWK